MDLDSITPSDFKSYFVRDFSYWSADDGENLEYVLDSDINKAFGEAKINFNQSLFGTDEQIEIAYLYLTAHYLVMDLQAAMDGLDSRGSFTVNSRSVGSVSESYTIPQSFIDDPFLNYFTQTRYGQKYLSLLQAAFVGNVVSVSGGTKP